MLFICCGLIREYGSIGKFTRSDLFKISADSEKEARYKFIDLAHKIGYEVYTVSVFKQKED